MIKTLNKKNYSGPIVKTIFSELVYYLTPTNLNYFWGFGSLAGLCFAIQLVSGIFLHFYYVPEADIAFERVEYIMNEVNGGWLFRYMHSNGASFFFLAVYLHMIRGLFFKSFKLKAKIWNTGILIWLAMMATAFLGYVLPWGQMSLWGATVIVKTFQSIPVIGDDICTLVWGGPSITTVTLSRFQVFHYVFAGLIAGLIVLHLAALHDKSSSNPLRTTSHTLKEDFYPLFTWKDTVFFILFLSVFFIMVIYYSNLLGHPDNYVKANPMVTPSHIVPEWYFLSFYGLLRTFQNKLGGIAALLGFIATLVTLPFLINTSTYETSFLKWYRIFITGVILFWVYLAWAASHTPDSIIGQSQYIGIWLYFIYFLLVVAGLNTFSKVKTRLSKNKK